MYQRICPYCGISKIDPGEHDCGCVEESKERQKSAKKPVAGVVLEKSGQYALRLEYELPVYMKGW